jgi:hypothetical protein
MLELRRIGHTHATLAPDIKVEDGAAAVDLCSANVTSRVVLQTHDSD